MARNLHRVLTSYVGIPCMVDHPKDVKVRSGDIVRVGKMAGLSLIDEQFGYGAGGTRELTGFIVNRPINPIGNEPDYPDGTVPVMFQMNEVLGDVWNDDANNPAPVGTTVYYTDTADGPAADVNYHLVVGKAAAFDAVLGQLREEIPANSTKKGAVIMVVASAAPDLMGTVNPAP